MLEVIFRWFWVALSLFDPSFLGWVFVLSVIIYHCTDLHQIQLNSLAIVLVLFYHVWIGLWLILSLCPCVVKKCYRIILFAWLQQYLVCCTWLSILPCLSNHLVYYNYHTSYYISDSCQKSMFKPCCLYQQNNTIKWLDLIREFTFIHIRYIFSDESAQKMRWYWHNNRQMNLLDLLNSRLPQVKLPRRKRWRRSWTIKVANILTRSKWRLFVM